MSTVIELQPEQFEVEVIQSKTPVLIDFYGTLCQPCFRMLPIIEEIAAERAGQLKVVKMNAHNNLEIAARFRVNAIPNFVLLSGGAPVGQRSGVSTKTDMLAWIDSATR